MKNLPNKNRADKSDIVQVYLESSWDKVVAVYNALAAITNLSNAIDDGTIADFLTAEDLDALAKLNALVLDATLGDSADFATAAQGALADTAIQGPYATQGEAEAGLRDDVPMSPLRVAQAIAVLAAGIQNNFVATTDPAAGNDSSEGYSVGSVWINTTSDESWKCADASIGAAVWIKTSLTSDELATVALTGDSDDLTEGTAKLLLTVAERAKLAAIEAGATADQTGAEIKSLYEAEADTNALTDALLTKLNNIEANATADQSNAEIEAAYNSQVGVVTQGDAEAGTSTTVYRWTPQRIAQAIAALAGGGSSSPLTTKGDLWGFSTVDARLPVGANDQVLTADSTQPLGVAWKAASGGGGGGLTVEFKTTSFTAVAGKKYKVDTTGGAVTVTLPAGTNLDNIVIQDVGHYARYNNIIILPNGSETIDNDTGWIIDQNDGDVDIAYNATNTNWEVSADGTPEIVYQNSVYTVLFKSAAYTAAAGDKIYTDCSSAAVTITLPASPTTGDEVIVIDDKGSAATNNITVARNGNTIAGVAADFLIDLNYGSCVFAWNGSDWRISPTNGVS